MIGGLQRKIWLGLLVSMVALIIVSGVYVQRDDGGQVKVTTIDKKGFYTLASYYIAALFMEGTPRDPTLAVGRIMYGMWWLVMLVLANGFSGHIRAMMMAPKEVFKVNSLEQLAEITDKIQPLTWRSSAFEDYFRLGSTGVHEKIWQAIQSGNGSMLLAEMFAPAVLRRLEQSQAIIVNGLLTTKALVGRQCSTLDIGNMYFGAESFYSHILAYGFRRGLDPQLVKLVNIRIRWLFESYLFQHWLDTENREFERCMTPTTLNEEQPLLMKDVEDIFLMFLACLLAGLVSLVYEMASVYAKGYCADTVRKYK